MNNVNAEASSLFFSCSWYIVLVLVLVLVLLLLVGVFVFDFVVFMLCLLSV